MYAKSQPQNRYKRWRVFWLLRKDDRRSSLAVVNATYEKSSDFQTMSESWEVVRSHTWWAFYFLLFCSS